MASNNKNLGEKIAEKTSCDDLKPVKNENMLKSPALLAVKLEEQAILSATSDSETEDDGFRTKTNKNQHKKQNQKKQQLEKDKQSRDPNSAAQDELEEEPPYEPPNQELQQRLIQQLEFYFSDENILKDTFLLKHIQKDKNGFVSLKLLASFRKMQRVTKNWRDLVFALEHEKSQKLQLNEKRNKVKRTQPLPEWDKTVHDRTVVVFNFESVISKNQSPIEAITAHFLSNFDLKNEENALKSPKNDENSSKIDLKSPINDENLAKNEENDQKLSKNQEKDIQKYSDGCEISLVRLIKPGRKVPKDIQGFLTKNHPEMANKPCALVEFRSVRMAREALKKFSGRDDWRGIQVVPLTKETLKKPIITTTGPDSLARSPSKSKGAINLHRALQERCSLNVQINAQGQESDGGGGSCSPRYHGNGGANNNDKRKLCQTNSDTHTARRSPLLTLNSPSATHKSIARARSNVSPEVRRKPVNAAEDSPLSCSPGSLGSGGSPWIRRRMLHAADSIGSSELCKNQICIIRQPQGPDGTKGFLTKRK